MATGFHVIQGTKHPLSRNLPGPRAAIWSLVLRAAICVSVSSCGIYSADEITATVVDADTKAPIEGVNVIAYWAVRGGINYGATVGYLNVMETVSDKNGRFHFSRWGPRPNFHLGEVRQKAPALALFNGGYRYTAAENGGGSLNAAPSRMRSDWDNQTIAMKRYVGTAPDYDAGFIALMTDTANLGRYGHWADIPRFLCALAREHNSLAARGVQNSLYSIKSLSDAGLQCRVSGGQQ